MLDLVLYTKPQNPGSLTEVGQHVHNHYSIASLVDNEVVLHTQWFKCRDFFNEVLASIYYPQNLYQIYGFSSNWLGSWDKKHVAMYAPYGYETTVTNLEHVNQVLTAAGLLPLKIVPANVTFYNNTSSAQIRGTMTAKPHQIVLFEFGQEYWQNSLFVSIYTAATRWSAYANGAPKYGSEKQIYSFIQSPNWPTFKEGVDAIKEKGNPFFYGDDYHPASAGEIHASSGLGSVIGRYELVERLRALKKGEKLYKYNESTPEQIVDDFINGSEDTSARSPLYKIRPIWVNALKEELENYKERMKNV